MEKQTRVTEFGQINLNCEEGKLLICAIAALTVALDNGIDEVMANLVKRVDEAFGYDRKAEYKRPNG